MTTWTEYEPMLTIRKVLSLVKESSEVTTIHVAARIVSSATGNYLVTIPDNVHLTELVGKYHHRYRSKCSKKARGFIVQEVENVK